MAKMYDQIYYLEQRRFTCTKEELLADIERCKIEARQALWDSADVIAEASVESEAEGTDERPSTANALGGRALDLVFGPSLVEPDVVVSAR